MIYPRLTVEQERTVVELCDADGNAYAIVEMKYYPAVRQRTI